MKEVKVGRVASPFKDPPFENFIQSPIGLVPKDGGKKTRLIFHLSYDFKDGQSVNYHMPKELCSVKYRDLDHAVTNCLHVFNQQQNSEFLSEEQKQQPIFMGKTDVQSAFRLLPMSKRSWAWLIMKAKNPKTGEFNFFVDKCLPFGSSISCAHFQRFSDVICFIIQFKTQSKAITNYLDDFLFVAMLRSLCNQMMQKFLDLCQEIGIPISDDKTVWASSRIIFLGLLLDGVMMTIVVLVDKKDKVVAMLQNLLSKKKATVKELQVLCGFLNFLSKAIFPGRAFTRRMYAKYSEVVNINMGSGNKWLEADKQHYKLKQHHHIRLDNDFKLDCKT